MLQLQSQKDHEPGSIVAVTEMGRAILSILATVRTDRLKRIGMVLLTLAGAVGCKQDIGNASWDVDVLAPVIRTELSMADLLADSLLESTADGALRLKVERPLIDLPLDSILNIPDTTIDKSIFSPFAATFQPGTEVMPITETTQYTLGDIALKKIILRQGTLGLRIKSILAAEVDFTYRIPVAQQFGNPFETTQTLAAGSAADTSIGEFEFDLTGYSIDLRGTDGTGFNTLETTFVLKTSEDGQAVSVGAFEPFFFLEYSFFDIVPDYALGYFGQQSNNVEDQNSEIDVLKRITSGQMFLDSVTIALSITNGVGADARFNLGQLSSINTRQNTTVDLSHDIIGSDLLLTRAQDITGNAEDVVSYQLDFQLDNSNSNIKQFIENLPDQLGFTFDFELNPLGNVSSGNDFFYYDSPFETLMDIDIPLRTTLVDLTLVDTLEWDLTGNTAVESVNSGHFTLIADNGFPMEGMVELILLDGDLNELDTLLVPSTIAAPPLDAENKVMDPLRSRIDIPIPDRTTGVLTQTKNVRIRVRFNTPNQPELIEFYDHYSIGLKLIGDLNINFGTSIF